MLGKWHIGEVGCWGCGMFERWDVQDVGCSGCGMLGMWDVGDVGCWGCGMFGMWDVRDVECSACGMFGMSDVGCGMLIYKMHIFLTSGIDPDILMKVFEGYIILLISAGWLLFNFYLKQKQRFSVWSFTEITSFIYFHEGNFPITKNNKKCRF